MAASIITNVDIYQQIAEEAFESMEEAFKAIRRRRPDGGGWIFALDPTNRSFKFALVYIAFSGMWLEAKLHLTISERFGKRVAKDIDRKDYEAKLELLGFLDADLRANLEYFRGLRREIMHEKAFLDSGKIRYAQDEAHKVKSLMKELMRRFEATEERSK
ncbi:hypothetical protein P775_28530 [Puniceibacterium antarcticum]|uniref:RiboL-PSP-HEPN domain-containing protein n=1 Tax=Puniceibacterium antarcticum TaxID=1206336 RepID=A0A2G8QTC9_9RHOB|nr:hypothetical protein [Puniceibacterium antarcticum]PIL12451.1 hypothetical protein P775_28530 [Puniceibacterium antarcticum]